MTCWAPSCRGGQEQSGAIGVGEVGGYGGFARFWKLLVNIVEQTRRRWRMELYKMRLLDSCSMSGATRPQKVDVCKLLHN